MGLIGLLAYRMIIFVPLSYILRQFGTSVTNYQRLGSLQTTQTDLEAGGQRSGDLHG